MIRFWYILMGIAILVRWLTASLQLEDIQSCRLSPCLSENERKKKKKKGFVVKNNVV